MEVVNRGLAICKIYLHVGSFQAILKVCARTYSRLPVEHSELYLGDKYLRVLIPIYRLQLCNVHVLSRCTYLNSASIAIALE